MNPLEVTAMMAFPMIRGIEAVLRPIECYPVPLLVPPSPPATLRLHRPSLKVVKRTVSYLTTHYTDTRLSNATNDKLRKLRSANFKARKLEGRSAMIQRDIEEATALAMLLEQRQARDLARRVKRANEAALSIQCMMRVHIAKRTRRELRNRYAAITIQRVVRGFQQRRRYLKLKQCRYKARRSLAARRLQRAYRSYSKRKMNRAVEAMRRKVGGKKVVRFCEHFWQRRLAHGKKKSEATSLLNKMFRLYRRKSETDPPQVSRLAVRHHASSVIQKHYRIHMRKVAIKKHKAAEQKRRMEESGKRRKAERRMSLPFTAALMMHPSHDKATTPQEKNNGEEEKKAVVVDKEVSEEIRAPSTVSSSASASNNRGEEVAKKTTYTDTRKTRRSVLTKQ